MPLTQMCGGLTFSVRRQFGRLTLDEVDGLMAVYCQSIRLPHCETPTPSSLDKRSA